MASKTPPLSIRLPPDVMALVDGWAGTAKVTRHAAIVALLRERFSSGPGAAAVKPASVARVAPKAEPAVHVAVPLYERRAFNPQPKRGKTK